MGVSILMTPGIVGRNFGKQVDITPGWRSKAAEVLRDHWGDTPMQLLASHDLSTLQLLAAGASVYSSDEANIWIKIAAALDEHNTVTIVLEY